jgi:hypothetical protein
MIRRTLRIVEEPTGSCARIRNSRHEDYDQQQLVDSLNNAVEKATAESPSYIGELIVEWFVCLRCTHIARKPNSGDPHRQIELFNGTQSGTELPKTGCRKRG